jgi:glutamyl-tRNA synthetase/glutamyl-Q tRNA(Asp) synthetase
MPGIIRFAPSPTGYLHEGHLLSALYVWAAALKWGLKIHLRIEDHDQGRARKEYIDGIREDLAWLGFKYHSESIQSSHFDFFQKVLDRLTAKGFVYPCTCSRKQLQSENPISETGEVIYQGKCSHVIASGVQRSEAIQGSEPHSLRVVITDKVINWHDERLGDFSENPKQQCGDFPIRDRDGFWTYQFAVCIDDLTEGITHIVRGEDIRNSTARQIALSQLISDTCQGDLPIPAYTRPLYLHHPLIVDSSGKKLSKREHAYSLRQDKDAGKTPQEILGQILYKAGFLGNNTPIALDQAIAMVAESL